MNKLSHSGLLYMGVFLALGIAVGGYFIGQTMYNAKVALNTAQAKGLAERRVQSDRASWKIGFGVSGSKKSKIFDLYKKSEANQKIIVDLLKENGFEDDEIRIGVLDYSYREFRDEDHNLVDEKHRLNGLISVETDKVELVSKVRVVVNK